MCEGWDLPRGVSGKGARHTIGSKGYGVFQGVFRKIVISLLRFRSEDRGAPPLPPPAALVANGAGAPGDEKLGRG
jgi:hypothetical protein